MFLQFTGPVNLFLLMYAFMISVYFRKCYYYLASADTNFDSNLVDPN